ncbi:GNAT family N-acetyltransferase [Paenibacillus pinisoli]|uniref:GNAT family N-acetyltransferase n=1 Tax=Paenibacillus pinisoli TaxID=1276110 RepID=UPI001FB1DC56|nr:GNAT family N-acetyltransferase [Paenibacillus pinisoli]
MMIRVCETNETAAIHAIINDAAVAYKGRIPNDRYREPYMTMSELERELEEGVRFWGCTDEGGELIGVMGLQDKGEVSLIRHAYVRTTARNQGVGGKLLHDLLERTAQPVLIGTWADASWAIRFL